jgi:hypothetical protein
MKKRVAKRRIRAAVKPEMRPSNSPDPAVSLPYDLRPAPGRPIYRFQFRDGYVAVDALAWERRGRDQLATYMALEAPNAERGRKFGSEKPPRSPSRLYGAAAAILARDGVERSASYVLTHLKAEGVVTAFDTKTVRWTDARAEARTTKRKKFETQLSRHRARLRS